MTEKTIAERLRRAAHGFPGAGGNASSMHVPPAFAEPMREAAEVIDALLADNARMREALGEREAARSQPGAASPSDCAEGVARLSDGWRDIASAPRDGTTIQARIPGHGEDNMIAWIAGALENERGSCGAWTFVLEDQEPPDCWSDGWCWTVNADGVSSAWPTEWKPALPTAPSDHENGGES